MSYSLDSSTGYVINDAGQVAIQYVISPNNKRVIIESTGGDYYFSAKNQVNLAWVNKADVPFLLGVMEKSCNCNNGTYKNAFSPATLTNVNIYDHNSM